ncbi:MAG TPA: hypothetical protein VMS08_01260 [Candidatus Saccharimonadia bacterium]|nr:hypothetical protein [Candidatus Saccharimonadia bacterium]
MVPRDILGRPLLVVEILPSKSHDDPALTEVARVEVPPSSKVFILAAAGYRVVPSSASRTITVRDDRG